MQFFLVVYQLVRRNLKKKLVKRLDNFRNCCIFASLFNRKQHNKTTKINSNNKKQKENDNKN